MNTTNIAELIQEGKVGEIKDAMEKSLTPGSQTFEQDLFRMIQQEKISVDEGLANADSATNLSLLIGNSGMTPIYKDGLPPPEKGRPGAPSFSEFKIS